MQKIDVFGNEVMPQQHLPTEVQSLKEDDWAEKYRPKKIDDLLLPEQLKATIKNTISMGLQNMILYSTSPGTGKTTTAMVIADELGCAWKKIDSSSNGRLDTVQNEISSYAMQKGVDGKPKIVILDEVDGVTSKAFFDSLRGVIEWSHQSLRFIMTCNHIHKVDAAITSRCTPISFNKSIDKDDEKALKTAIFKRLKHIAVTETGSPDKVSKDAIVDIINNTYPDVRSMIKRLQWNYITNAGEIKPGLIYSTNAGMDSVWQSLINSDWSNARRLYNETASDPGTFFREFLDYSLPKCPEALRMYLSHVVSEYQYRSVFQVDQEMNITCGLFPKIIQLLEKK